MAMDPPRARFVTPMAGQFNEWARMLNLIKLGVKIGLDDLTRRDLDGLLLVSRAAEKARERKSESDRRKREASRG
jgi:hypothetical protein